MRRSRRRHGVDPARYPLIGGVAVALIAVLTVLTFGGVFDRALQRKGNEVTAVFRDASQLAKNSPVRVRGVEQGRVRNIDLEEGGRSATVTMEVYDSAKPLHADAKATLKMRNALGGNYYIDLEPGTASSGPLDGVIPMAQTTNAVEVDALLAHLRRSERAGLKTTLSEVPDALEDEQRLPELLGTVSDAAPGLQRGVAAARGERAGDLTTLVRNTARVTDSLSTDTGQITDLIEGGTIATETIARRKRETQQAISRAAAVLPEVESTMRSLDLTLRNADPLLARLRRPVTQVAPTLARLRPTVIEADRLLRGARPLLEQLRPAAAALASAAREGDPLLRDLDPSITRLAETILPDLNLVDQTSKRTTAQMVGPTISGLGAAAGQYDNLSHMIGLAAGGGERAIDTSPCRTYFLDPDSVDAGRVLECREIAKTIDALFSYNPIPGTP